MQGTWQFLSIRLLRDTQAYHEVSDDIESFIWILLWASARYSPNTLSPEARANFLQQFDAHELDPGSGKLYLAAIASTLGNPQLKPRQLDDLLMELTEQVRHRYDGNKRFRTLEMSDDDVKKIQERLSTHEWMDSTLLRRLDNEEWRRMKDGAIDHPVAQNTDGMAQSTKKRKEAISEYQEERASKRNREGTEDEEQDEDEESIEAEDAFLDTWDFGFEEEL